MGCTEKVGMQEDCEMSEDHVYLKPLYARKRSMVHGYLFNEREGRLCTRMF